MLVKPAQQKTKLLYLPRIVEFSSDDYLVGFKLLRALIALGGISYN